MEKKDYKVTLAPRYKRPGPKKQETTYQLIIMYSVDSTSLLYLYSLSPDRIVYCTLLSGGPPKAIPSSDKPGFYNVRVRSPCVDLTNLFKLIRDTTLPIDAVHVTTDNLVISDFFLPFMTKKIALDITAYTYTWGKVPNHPISCLSFYR